MLTLSVNVHARIPVYSLCQRVGPLCLQFCAGSLTVCGIVAWRADSDGLDQLAADGLVQCRPSLVVWPRSISWKDVTFVGWASRRSRRASFNRGRKGQCPKELCNMQVLHIAKILRISERGSWQWS